MKITYMWIMVEIMITLENKGYEILVVLGSDHRLKKRLLLEIQCKYNQILRITKKMI
jgi:hypothetical protein